jgi:hypothetical protein
VDVRGDSFVEILCNVLAVGGEAEISRAVVVDEAGWMEGVFGLDSATAEGGDGFDGVEGAALVEALKGTVESRSEDEGAFGVRGLGVDELVFCAAIAGEERFQGRPIHSEDERASWVVSPVEELADGFGCSRRGEVVRWRSVTAEKKVHRGGAEVEVD